MPLEWPSCYFHKELRMFMIIYVDDFKMSGPTAIFVGGWKAITDHGIRLDEPAELGHFLGCRHVRREITREDGTGITVMEYDFECSLRNSLTRYEDIAHECGTKVNITPHKSLSRWAES